MNRKRCSETPAAAVRSAARGRWRGGLAFVVVVIGAAWVAWVAISERRGEGSGKSGSGSPKVTNVLLITLDTTRADYLGCYGHAEAQTPTMDALAESGVRFEHAFCQVPLTLPSHASLLTGSCPPRTGVRINGAAALGGDVPSIAEVFQRRGYRTAAFIGAAVLNSSFGLSRGFDHYDDFIVHDAKATTLQTERTADQVCDATLGWLKVRPQDAFFAWVHFFDPHFPFTPPRGFREGLANPYDGEIAFVDAELARLIAWLDEEKLRDSTMIVLVGDHGEGLGDHGEGAHGLFIYNATMHVPLIISSPGSLGTPRTVSSPVGVVDLFPTIVDLMGWEVPDDLDGRSLAYACRSGEAPALPVYGESIYPRRGFGWASLRSLTVDRWKYIDAPKPELYDWESDPAELSNVVDDFPDVAERMRADLLDLASHMEAEGHAASPATLDSQELERLAALGYVAGPTTIGEQDDGVQRRDPKDMHVAYGRFTSALSLTAQGDFEEVVRVLQPLIQASPESGEILRLLGDAYLKLRRYAEAQGAYEASLEATPDIPRPLYGLGEALRNQGRINDAIEYFARALAIVPDWESAHQGLGAACFQLKQYARAEFHCRRCVEKNPTSPGHLANLGALLMQMRRPIEADPVHARDFDTLAAAHAAQGDFSRAIEAATRASSLAGARGQIALQAQIEARLGV